MNRDVLDVHPVGGIGYRPLIDFGAWRVAILSFDDARRADRIDRMERHRETDEVFVLLHGSAVLLLGGNASAAQGLDPTVMEPGKIYNVRRNAWHAALLSVDASILLVENSDTGTTNTEFSPLGPDERDSVRELARRYSMP